VIPARDRSLPRRCAPHARAGFTLVELTVVALILLLILGVASKSWVSLLPNQQFNSAVRNLSEVLHGTRSDAISRNREFRIYYDLDAESYWIRTPFRPGGGFALGEDEEHVLVHETDLAKAGIDLVQVTIDGVPYTDGVVYVRFDPLGASSLHIVQLRQVQFDRDFTLEVLPLTGEIRLHDGLYQRDLAEEGDFR